MKKWVQATARSCLKAGSLLASTGVVSAGLWVTGTASAATYVVEGPNYDRFVEGFACDPLSPYCRHTAAMRPRGWFTMRKPFAPGLNGWIDPTTNGIVDYAFDSGVIRFSTRDAQSRLSQVYYAYTDATGKLGRWGLSASRWRLPGTAHAVGDRVDYFQLHEVNVFVRLNSNCQQITNGDECHGFGNSGSWDAYAGPAAPRLLVPVPVYRFYNATTRSHFFTASEAERDHVIATNKAFAYEGIAFYARGSAEAEAIPVFRFYNHATGAHFYTANQGERDMVVEKLKSFQFEGAAWYGLPEQMQNAVPVYRFYRPSTGNHFYTVDQKEMEQVRDFNKSFNFEGVAYWAWPNAD
jgi:hypothetical protein